MKYTLRQLEVFIAAASTENITRAADQLAMSQSAASSALKELETQFDVQFFDRIGKRLKLNEQGFIFRPKAQALLEQASELEISLGQGSSVGNLKIGATLTIGNYIAVGIMSRMMKDFPEARINLEVANTSEISQKVFNFEIDIGLIEGELQHPDLEVIPWRHDELTVFCNPAHPLAKKKKLIDKDLLAQNWILRETGSGTRQAFDRAMQGIMPELQVILELQHTEAIKRAVEAGLGLGCLSKIALVEAFERGSLVPLPVPKRDFTRQFYFILHKQKYKSAGINRWIDYCL